MLAVIVGMAIAATFFLIFVVPLLLGKPPCMFCGKPAKWEVQEYVYQCDACRNQMLRRSSPIHCVTDEPL